MISLALFSIVATILATCSYMIHRATFLPLPPGPRKLPLLGNLLSMPRKLPWVTFARWSEAYSSDIIHLNVAGTSIVVLNTIEAATDLLDKRSSIYSSRPRMVMAKELVGWDAVFMILPYGIFRFFLSRMPLIRWFDFKERNGAHLGVCSTASFKPAWFQISNLNKLAQYTIYSAVSWTVQTHLLNISDSPLFGSLTMSITYGIDVQSKNDPYIGMAETSLERVARMAVPGSFLVDVFPILKHVPEWFPGAAFQRLAKEWRREMLEMIETPFNAVKRDMEQEQLISKTALTAYAGGADTTVSFLSMFILGIISNPEALKMAQDQIDAVCRDSLPTHEDKSRLPYISAIFLETLRWNSIAPFGLPHFIEVEDEYRGYRIPAGSIIVPNIWAMSHNSLTYSEPFSFKPERFIKDGLLDPSVLDPTTFAFGFGRRLCPGIAFAESSAWIAIASMLAVFDIKKSVDESGRIEEPTLAFTSSIVSHPEPFSCSIKPRSGVHAERVRATLIEM